MTTDTTTLRAGILVSLKTTMEGNVEYVKTEIDPEHELGDGGTRARWETERTTINAAEHEDAVKVRGKCRSLITAVCAKSQFGLLCRLDFEPQLDAAIAEARVLADRFNATAQLTEINIYALKGKFVNDDVEAVKAINSEVRGLIDSMENGIKKLDVDMVREAANRAKNLGTMLSEEANETLKVAIAAARKVARAIVKEGEVVSGEIDRQTLAALAGARTAFLDVGPASEVINAVAEIEVPQVDFVEPLEYRSDVGETLEVEVLGVDEYEDISRASEIDMDFIKRGAAENQKILDKAKDLDIDLD